MIKCPSIELPIIRIDTTTIVITIQRLIGMVFRLSLYFLYLLMIINMTIKSNKLKNRSMNFISNQFSLL